MAGSNGTVSLCFTRSALAILLITVFVQIGQQVGKYLSGKTTTARSRHSHSRLTLPAVSLCHGVRAKEGSNLTLFSPNGSRADMDEAWESALVARDLADFLMATEIFGVGRHDFVYPDAITSGEAAVTVETRDVFAGRCHTLRVKSELRKSEMLQLHLQHAKDDATGGNGKLILYFHHPRAHIGLNDHYWPGATVDVHVLSSSDRDDVEVGLTKTIIGDAGSAASEEDFFDCVDETVREKLRDLEEQVPLKLCYVPSLRSILSFKPGLAEALRPCREASDYFLSSAQLYQALIVAYDSGCPAPVQMTRYRTQRRRKEEDAVLSLSGRRLGDPASPTLMRTVKVWYDSTEVTAEEEYLLLDGGAVVSAAGGVVGIFLGWSLLDAVRISDALICRRVKKALGE